MQSEETPVTHLANLWAAGDSVSGDTVLRAIEADLRAIAYRQLQGEGACALCAEELVNEAVIRLLRIDSITWQSRAHLMAMIARIMRRCLVDLSRQRNAAKRAGRAVTLTTQIAGQDQPVSIIALEEALGELEKIDPLRSQLVEMKFFAGMKAVEIAAVLGVSEPTVKRRWSATRLWLAERMTA